jgi:NodT family efflux transporter outer membrane factor (OMF) lipoprotein
MHYSWCGQRWQSLLLAIAVTAFTGGCAAGPDYRAPEAPAETAYSAATYSAPTASAPVSGGEAQRLVLERDIPAEWWTLFHSPALDQLIRQALKDSPTIEAAAAAVRRAHEELRALSGSTYFPSLDASATITRSRYSGARFGQPGASFPPFTLYNASVNVTYALDLFGGARRELEALRAQVDYQRFLLEGAHQALAANIVTAAVQDASLRGQLRAIHELLAAQEEQLGIVEGRFQAGGTSRTDVLLQRATVSKTRATLVPLEKAASGTRYLLAVLAGRLPSEAAMLPEFELDSFDLPRDLPVTLPSALARQRPDIRAAEAVLHAASAQVGAATANLYPRITLNGSYGSEATKTGDLFSAGSAVWNLGAGLLQPLFHGGELRAKRRAAIAAYDGALADYRQTVLLAFRNVADSLRALELDAQGLRAQAEAEQAARESFEMAQKQFHIGAVSHLTVLIAEGQYRETKVALVQARAARYADTAALFQSLGGGWWNRAEREEGAEKSKAE